MFEILSFLAVLFAVISGIYGAYKLIIKPRRNKTKLKEVSILIEKWFDLLDINLENNLNIAELNNYERKIREYIDNNLRYYKIKPKKSTITKWNKKMGIKKELVKSPQIFQEFSRVPLKGMSLDMFFTMVMANFYNFNSAYNSGKIHECNFAEIEMPVMFFKFYVSNL